MNTEYITWTWTDSSEKQMSGHITSLRFSIKKQGNKWIGYIHTKGKEPKVVKSSKSIDAVCRRCESLVKFYWANSEAMNSIMQELKLQEF